MSSHQRKPPTDELTALLEGHLEVEGRLPWSSNYTFLVSVNHKGVESQAIYKPEEGEQPLWDFPGGLYKREVAAYELATALGWPNIPATVVREEGPFGVGSLQHFVSADFEQHYFVLMEDEAMHEQLFAMAVFDVIANNTDRKGGHCLVDTDGTIWGIDHGVCFNAEPKLRTVIWDFEGHPISAELLVDIARVCEDIPHSLAVLLAPEEVIALQDRMRGLLAHPFLPPLVSQRQYPYPLI